VLCEIVSAALLVTDSGILYNTIQLNEYDVNEVTSGMDGIRRT